MLTLTLSNLWARRRRAASIAVAVLLGVAFLAGTLVLGDTLSANFDRLFTDVSAGTDVVVRNATDVDDSPTPDENAGPIDAALLDTVAAVDGVAHAEGQIVGYGALLGADGDAIGGNGPPRQAGSWVTDPALNPYRLVEGRVPAATSEVVVNRGAAEAGDLAVGDRTVVQTPDPVEVTIVGIATFGNADGLGETTWTAFTLPGAEANVTGQPGRVTTIVVRGEDGIGSDTLRDRISATLPDGVEAITGSDLAEERIDGINEEFLGQLRMFLVAFAAIALLVASITIANTFAITVAHRTRELALLRAVGASRRQVRRTVTLEALAIGVIAAALGLVAGLGIAGFLKGVFDAFGGALPAGGLEIRPASLAIAFGVGVAVTVLAAQLPARRAAMLPPVAALRDYTAEARSPSRPRAAAGAVLVAAAVAAGVVSVTADASQVAGMAALVLVAGTIVLAPSLVPRIAGPLGAVLLRLRGAAGRLADQNARRNPRRTAATATALVIGVAVVTLFTVFAASLRTSVEGDIGTAFDADLTVNTPVFGGGLLSPRIVEELEQLPHVDQAVAVGGGPARLDGASTFLTATDPARIDEVVDIAVTDGSLADVDTAAVAIDQTKADAEGWRIGTTIEATFQDGATTPLTVRAIYKDNELLEQQGDGPGNRGGSVLVADALWATHTSQPTKRTVFVTVVDGTDLDAARSAIVPVATRYGGDVQDPAEYAAAATGGLDLLLGVVYVLLALAIIIALFGIANTLSLAVHERQHEIGLLRAVGQTRAQARSTIRLESVIVSSFGTLIGLALGAFLGWVLYATVADDTTVTVPVAQLATVGVIGAAAGALAAVRPARRAAGLAILDAIAAP